MQNTMEFESSKPGVLPYAPIVLVMDALRRWLLILTAAVLAGVMVYIAADAVYTPEYETSATLVITTRDSTATVYTNLNATSEIATVFSKLLNSSILQKVVLEEAGLSSGDYTVSAAAIADTNLLTLRVRSSDPRKAFLVINCLISNHAIVTTEVVGDIVIEALQQPTVPTRPVNGARQASLAMMAALAAGFACCCAVVIYSHFRDTVRSRKEAENKLSCRCLSEIPHESKYKTFADRFSRRKASLIITDPGSSFRFVETIRKLRRRIEQHMGHGKVLLVTSVAENEGKTTIAVNVALTLAQKHAKVLLIDLDLRKSACHKILNQKAGSFTVADVLSGQATLESAVQREQISGLYTLLSRSKSKVNSNRVIQLLNSGNLKTVLQQARKQYDYVILDMSPMSAAPDTEYVMDYADASLLVVRQNQVYAKSLNKAVDALQKGKAQLLGCVLNNAFSSEIVSEGNTYSYRYGKYGKYGKYGAYGKYHTTYAYTNEQEES